MNIGFDIDGVLTDIERFQLEKGAKFFKEKYNKEIVNKKGYDIKEIFDCTNSEEKAFWTKYLFPYSIKAPIREGASEITKYCHQKEDKIFIVTKREFTDRDDSLGKLMRYIVEEYLKHNGVEYDEIIFSKGSKLDAIRRFDIEVMFEDSAKNIEELKDYTNIICVNAGYNEDIIGKNIYRIDSLKEARGILDSIRNDYNKKIVDEIKPLSGKPSIDKPWLKYYTYGQHKQKYSDMLIFDYMYEENKSNLNNIALEYYGQKMTFKEFFEKIDQCAKGYKSLGISEGDIVTICMPNTPEAVISFYALNKIGAVSNMIHPLKSENEIKDYLNEVSSKVMLGIDINYEKINNIIDSTSLEKVIVGSAKDSMPFVMKHIYQYSLKKNHKFYNEKHSDKYLTWDSFMRLGKSNEKISSVEYNEKNAAVIMHTGGTTGSPKGVVLSNKNFNSMIGQFSIMSNNFAKQDKMVSIMPVFHGFGLCSSIHLPLSFGVTSILMPQFDLKYFEKLMKKEKPNHIIGVPTLWKAIVEDKKFDNIDLSSIKYTVSGGDTMKDEFEHKINSFLESHGSKAKICKGYGLSEAVAGATFAFDDCNKIGSIGIPMVNTTFKIVKPSTEEELGYNEKGELCISGDTVMQGYYNNSLETDMVLRKHEDGKIWLHTGDTGYIDEDGILYYSDRLKRMFISSGVNVYPSEIEKTIEQIEKVKTCAAIPVSHPYKGTVPKAIVVLEEGNELDESLILKIKDICSKSLDKYHNPVDYEQVYELPVTSIGKIDYKQLEENEKEKVKVKSLKK